MFLKFFISLFFIGLLGCSSTSLTQQSSATGRTLAQDSQVLPVGGRFAVHGMVLVGNGGIYYLEHIPMLSPPHDYQVVARVTLKKADGTELNNDFSQGTFVVSRFNSLPISKFVFA